MGDVLTFTPRNGTRRILASASRRIRLRNTNTHCQEGQLMTSTTYPTVKEGSAVNSKYNRTTRSTVVNEDLARRRYEIGIHPITLEPIGLRESFTDLIAAKPKAKKRRRPVPDAAVEPLVEAPIKSSESPNDTSKVFVTPLSDVDVNDTSRVDTSRASLNGSSKETFEDVARDKTRARAAALGIKIGAIDEAFSCPLPKHEHEANLIWAKGSGYWLVRCGETRKTYGLAQVRAAQGYGYFKALSKVAAQRWTELLDHEAGLELVAIGQVPENISENAQKIARGHLLYLGLRAKSGGYDVKQSYTFTRKWTMAWCGVSENQAREGTGELKKCGFIKWTGEKIDGAYVWQLGTVVTAAKRERKERAA